MADYDYEGLIQAGYNPAYVDMLRSSGLTPEQIQTEHFNLMEERRKEAEAQALRMQTHPMWSDPTGGGRPSGLTVPHVPPAEFVPYTPAAPSIGPKQVGAHRLPSPPDEPGAKTYVPSHVPGTPDTSTPEKEDDEDDAFGDAIRKMWEDEQTGRQYDYDTERYKMRMQAAGVSPDIVGRAAVPGTGPPAVIHPEPGIQERVGMTREERAGISPEFRGKHFRGGQEYRPTPEHLRGVGGASARAKALGQRGAFTASAPLMSEQAPPEVVNMTQSPQMQRLWYEQRAKSLGLRTAEAEQRLGTARAEILEAQAEEANLPPAERTKRMTERIVGVYERIKDYMLPDVEQKVKDRMTMLETSSPELFDKDPGMRKVYEERLRRQIMQENLNNMTMIVANLLGMQSPEGAAAISKVLSDQAAMAAMTAPPLATPE